MEDFYALSPEPYISAALPLPEDRHKGLSATSSGVRLLKHTKSTVANLPAAVFSRWIHNQDCAELNPEAAAFSRPSLPNSDLDAGQREIPMCRCSRQRQQIIVTISGTSSIQQAIHDLRATRRPYPGAPDTPATVHTGFWELYKGMKAGLIECIVAGLQLEPDKIQPETAEDFNSTDSVLRELVVTGHSMGGAIAHLLCMDLLSPYFDPEQNRNRLPPLDIKKVQESHLQRLGIHRLQIVTFGEPRTGNQGLVDHWVALKKRHEHEYGIPIQEWSIKAYSDGAFYLSLNLLSLKAVSPQVYPHCPSWFWATDISLSSHFILSAGKHTECLKVKGSADCFTSSPYVQPPPLVIHLRLHLICNLRRRHILCLKHCTKIRLP